MNRIEVLDRLTSIFRKQFSNDSLIITDDMTAGDVDQWDSLSHMILINEIENSLLIKFKLKELNKMNNVGAMIDIIVSKF